MTSRNLAENAERDMATHVASALAVQARCGWSCIRRRAPAICGSFTVVNPGAWKPATPAGTVPVAEWLTVKDDKIAAIRVFFDARPFAPPPSH